MTNEANVSEVKKTRRPKRTLEERKKDAQAELEVIAERELQDLMNRQGSALVALQAFGRRAKEMGRDDVVSIVGEIAALMGKVKL